MIIDEDKEDAKPSSKTDAKLSDQTQKKHLNPPNQPHKKNLTSNSQFKHNNHQPANQSQKCPESQQPTHTHPVTKKRSFQTIRIGKKTLL